MNVTWVDEEKQRANEMCHAQKKLCQSQDRQQDEQCSVQGNHYMEMCRYAMEAMMESSTELSFLKDSSLRYVCVSRTFAEMVGYGDTKAIIGKTDYDLFMPELADHYRNDDLRIMESGQPMIDMTEILPSVNGVLRYSSTSKYPFRDSLGQIVGLYGVGRDVTEDKEAFNLLKTLTDTIPGGLATYELSNRGIRTIYLTDGVYDLVGKNKEEFDIRETNPLDYVLPEHREQVKRQFQRLQEDGTPVNCTYRVNLENNEYRYINLRGAQSERQGDVITLNAVMLDVTEHMIAKEKVNMMEQENRRRYEHELTLRRGLVKDSIFYYQLNLTTGMVEEYEARNAGNTTFVYRNGLDRNVLNDILTKIDPEYVDLVRNRLLLKGLRETYRKGRRSDSLIYRRILSDSKYHWVKMDVFIMEKPNCDEVIAFLYCHDIDREWKNHMSVETILDEDIESVFYIDTKTGMASISHMIERVNYNQVYGEFQFDLESKKCSESVIVEEDREKFNSFYHLKNLLRLLEKDKVVSATYRVRERTGIRHKLSKAYFLDSKKEAIVLTRRDITRLNEDTQRQKKELQQAVDRANEASHAKSIFLSNMSHDIRTPLNAILAFSSEEFLEHADERKMRRYLSRINESGEYLLGIINDVLDMSRIERNSISLRPECYTLEDFKRTIYNVIEPLSRNKGVEFIINTDSVTTMAMNLDHMRFNQIFINLLSNAVKFTGKGGKVELMIEECIKSDENRMRFYVKDNGIGMKEEFLPHAFESFSQEYRPDTEETYQGTGLGLSIVHQLVELMSGTITVESRVYEGTTFTLEFPVGKDCCTFSAKKTDQAEYNRRVLNGVRVLLAEDKEVNIEIVKILLEKYGCMVESAANGLLACEKFEHSAIEYYKLILMDIRMPVMSGLEATECIRSMERKDAKKVPIIALTADAFLEDEINALEVGMNAHIGKPIIPEDFYRVCCRLINQPSQYNDF